MTIRSMMRAIALLLVVSALGACGDDGDIVDTAAAEEVQAAQAEASDAAAAVARLETRIEALEEQLDAAAAAGSKAGKRLDYLAGRLKSSVEDLRGSMREVRGVADGAAAEMSAAVSKVAEVARRLTVLEDRFNFHLKKEHGGG
ncbi:MAG: hypothetical protein ACR2KQ_03170 [Actinomycetota bacterium]